MRLLLSSLLSLLLLTPVLAQDGPQGFTIEIDFGETNPQFPSTAFDSARDRFLVLWHLSDVGTLGRFVGTDGSLDGPSFLVESCGRLPRLAYNALTGDFVVLMFCDGRLVTQRLDADGVPQGSQQLIANANPSGLLDLAFNDASGEFLAVWQDSRNECCDIYGQRLGGDGSLKGSDVVITDAPGRQVQPQVAGNSRTGEFLVAWSDCRADVNSFCTEFNSPGEGYGAIVAPSGGVGADSRITDFTRSRLGVAYNSARNSFMAVWNDTQNGNAIMGRALGADVVPTAAPFVVSDAFVEFQNFPALVYSEPADRFLALWSGEEGDGNQVVGSVISSDGLTGASFSVGGEAIFFFPEGAASDTGEILAVFQDFFEGTNALGQIFLLEPLPCFSNDTQACLQGDRFVAEVTWTDFEGETGPGRLVQDPASDSVLFYFFRRTNWEFMVKVLDGCNNATEAFWVFAAGTTNLAYTLTVTDTASGEVREYVNPLGVASAAVTDTNAFATCP